MGKIINPQHRMEWEMKISAQKVSGLSIAQWCKENQLEAHTFYYWRDRYFPKEKLLSFSELKSNKSTGITLEHDDLRIHLEANFDPLVFRRLMQALTGLKC